MEKKVEAATKSESVMCNELESEKKFWVEDGKKIGVIQIVL